MPAGEGAFPTVPFCHSFVTIQPENIQKNPDEKRRICAEVGRTDSRSRHKLDKSGKKEYTLPVVSNSNKWLQNGFPDFKLAAPRAEKRSAGERQQEVLL